MGAGAFALALLAAALTGVVDNAGKPADPFASSVKAHVLLFVRTDCPITNRYAPEIQRLAAKFDHGGVEFWLVYPDRSETSQSIQHHITEYHLPGKAVRDSKRELVQRAAATVAPQAALFDAKGKLMYSGRIDDRYVSIGKSRPSPTTHDLEAAIETLLGGGIPSPAKTRAVGCNLADLE